MLFLIVANVGPFATGIMYTVDDSPYISAEIFLKHAKLNETKLEIIKLLRGNGAEHCDE